MPTDAPVQAYIGLGSNLEDPVRQVCRAFAELDAIARTRCVTRSSLYRSAPMGPAGQPDYINAVAAVETGLSPDALLDALQAIEQTHGRVRGAEHWGPRTLDLDLLLFGAQSRRDVRLTLPHPGLHQRAFVLYPLQEIAPDLVIPGYGLLRELARQSAYSTLERVMEPQ
ncbi:MAG: 2-amino-4-hydroxy-6-hydroxymethyldihydropteridine diphosphokinase [Gammaproteobacteria bacterium]